MAAVRDRWATWLLETRHGGDEASLSEMLGFLEPLRDRVLDGAEVAVGETVLDVGCGDGLIGFGALPRVGPDGRVIFSDVSQDLLDRCAAIAGDDERCRFVLAPATDLEGIEDESVDVVTLRSVLIYVDDRDDAFREFFRVLRPGGRVSLFEPINSFGYPGPADRWGPWDVTPVRGLADRVKGVFSAIHAEAGDAMHNFRAEEMPGWAEGAGFREVHLEARYDITPSERYQSWDTYERSPGNPLVPSLAEAIDSVLEPDEAERFRAHLRSKAEAGDGTERSAHAYLTAVKQVPRGYMEGPAAEEAERRLEELERGSVEEAPAERLAVMGATDDNPERHFLGWRDEVDPDALFESGEAWGITVVRVRAD